jgi:hypothetical protein
MINESAGWFVLSGLCFLALLHLLTAVPALCYTATLLRCTALHKTATMHCTFCCAAEHYTGCATPPDAAHCAPHCAGCAQQCYGSGMGRSSPSGLTSVAAQQRIPAPAARSCRNSCSQHGRDNDNIANARVFSSGFANARRQTLSGWIAAHFATTGSLLRYAHLCFSVLLRCISSSCGSFCSALLAACQLARLPGFSAAQRSGLSQ